MIPAISITTSASRVRHAALSIVASAVAILTQGCHQFEEHRDALSALNSTGRYDQVAAVLDDPKTKSEYGSKNELLWQLDRGAVALALHDDDRTISLLEDAERRIEAYHQKSLTDQVAQWTLNDTATPYVAEPYEDIYVNVLKLLAQLERGQLSGGATVEARRASSKADHLRDLYVKSVQAAHQQGREKLGGGVGSGGAGQYVSTAEAGQFVESPLGAYLSAITFMKTGDPDFQQVAAKRLTDDLQLAQSFGGQMALAQPQSFAGLGDLDPSASNVLVVALSGRGPVKYAERIGPIPIFTFPLYFELPKLRSFPSDVSGARVEIQGDTGAGATLSMVEDLSAVATENHRRMLPLIYTRTLLRAAIKGGLSAAATELARSRVNDRDQGLVQIAGAVAGLALMMSTEKADLRSWIFLPGQARVGLLKLQPGTRRVRVHFLGAGGGTVYTSDWRTVEIPQDGGGLGTIVVRYWR